MGEKNSTPIENEYKTGIEIRTNCHPILDKINDTTILIETEAKTCGTGSPLLYGEGKPRRIITRATIVND